MEFIDYYKSLGLTKTATTDEIKKAYRQLARKLHPDTNPDDKNAKRRFQEVNEANEVLSNPEKRKKYDQYGNNLKARITVIFLPFLNLCLDNPIREDKPNLEVRISTVN